MKNIIQPKNLTVIFFLCWLLLSCDREEPGLAEQQQTNTFFPIQLGNSWTYRDQDDALHSVTIESMENIDNEDYYKFSNFPFPFHDIPGVSLFDGEGAEGWVRQDNESVYLRLILQSNIATSPFEINIFRNEEKGSSWVDEFVIDYQIGATTLSVPVIYNFSVIETNELGNINGTDYENIVTIRYTASLSYFDEPYVQELEGEYTFSQNVGIVLSKIISTANGTTAERDYSISDYELK